MKDEIQRFSLNFQLKLLKFQLKKILQESWKFSVLFLPRFCALFCDIAQSSLNCACTQENHGIIFSLLRFLS